MCDTEAGEVFWCWVQNGVFVSAGVSLVEVVPAYFTEHWVVSRFLVWYSRNSVHDDGLVGRIKVAPGAWMLPGDGMIARSDWWCWWSLRWGIGYALGDAAGGPSDGGYLQCLCDVNTR